LRKRLDLALVEHGLATGRDRARALVMSGQVYVNSQKADKAGEPVKQDDHIEVRGGTLGYVSRGGLKLARAIEAFGLDLRGAVCCDFGASTGGFTDCMLQNGAQKVYAFDVGYGQLAWSLRQDPRVAVFERTNVRHLTGDELDAPADFVGVDVSFISLRLILPAVWRSLRDGGAAVCLIKPQFEAGRDKVGKKGVVRDVRIHRQVIAGVMASAEELGFSIEGVVPSPIKGPQGNIEYLLYLQKRTGGHPADPGMAEAATSAAENEWGKCREVP
jgi:23S rRNA (cytidine1920-2'-O)/16S rRNA (cytidine1409-2'-O)-methyltransferase